MRLFAGSDSAHTVEAPGHQGIDSLKAVAPVQIRSGLRVKVQVKGLIAGDSGRALIICHRFVTEFWRHVPTSEVIRWCSSASPGRGLAVRSERRGRRQSVIEAGPRHVRVLDARCRRLTQWESRGCRGWRRSRGLFRGAAGARAALGRQLAASRRAAGLSQEQLAPLSGYSQSTVANSEIGRQRVPRGFWRRCDDALERARLVITTTGR